MPALPPYLNRSPSLSSSEPCSVRGGGPSARMPPPRIPDRVVFEKLVKVLVFGCAYRRMVDESCSATTLCEWRDEWIELGVIDFWVALPGGSDHRETHHQGRLEPLLVGGTTFPTPVTYPRSL